MKMKQMLKAATCAAVMTMSSLSFAEWQPDGPITLQVGFGAGGSIDTLARAIATQMERGNTLPFSTDSFDYLGTVVVAPLAVVAPADAPYNSVDELIAYSKSNGGALIAYDGGEMRLIMQAINNTEQANFELVSYKSGSEIIQGLLGGQLQAGWGAGAHIQYVASGDLKMLAVATQTRQNYAPETTSFIEQGFPYSAEPYFYLAAPKGLKPEVRDALANALDKAIQSDALASLIGNVMLTVPSNLGPNGTEAKLVNGISEMAALLKASVLSEGN